MKVLIAYVPVLHRGYEDFFLRHRDADMLVLFGHATIANFEWLKKDLRSVDPVRMKQAIKAWDIFRSVELFEDVSFQAFNDYDLVVMPDETECRLLAQTLFVGKTVALESVHLRYDKKKTESTTEIVAPEIDWPEALHFMNIADGYRVKSYDWWIQVTAMIVRDGSLVLTAWNEHRPDIREALYMGDPRSNYKRGVNIELSLADHAESALIGEAARMGIPLLGTDLYVTTFPCPSCARLIGRSGVRRLFFRRGYAVLDGDKMLRDKSIEIFKVK